MASINFNLGILGGKPVIRGTRVSVELIMKMVAQGMSIGEIKEELPHLSENQIKTAIEYASGLVKRVRVLPTRAR